MNRFKNTDHEMLLHVCEKLLAVLTKISPTLEALPEIDVVYLSTVLLSTARNCLSDSKIYDYICLWVYPNGARTLGQPRRCELGVPIVYSNINNTAMLIEIAQKESKHQPDLSFGTHFFQDLVEENIKYLPLYPDDAGILFNRAFFNSPNSLGRILPQYAHLHEVVKVIDIQKNFFNKQLHVLMNADLEKAVAYLDEPAQGSEIADISIREERSEEQSASGWKWRHFMAEQLAQKIDMEAYSIKGIYLFGSTNNCTARDNSDIDLLIHFDGSTEQRKRLDIWLSGWSMALSEINFLRTGYRSAGLLDIHYVTDEDIRDKDSFAIKIDSPYDPACPLRITQK